MPSDRMQWNSGCFVAFNNVDSTIFFKRNRLSNFTVRNDDLIREIEKWYFLHGTTYGTYLLQLLRIQTNDNRCCNSRSSSINGYTQSTIYR